MKKLILILLLLLLVSLVLEGQVLPLSDLLMPRHIGVDEYQIYFTEEATVSITFENRGCGDVL